ncbi:MAG: hypothetical protein ACTSWW_09775 [Promethearchaeota archaeon]
MSHSPQSRRKYPVPLKSLLGAMFIGFGLTLMFLTSSDTMSGQSWYVQLSIVTAVLLLINVVLYIVFNRIYGNKAWEKAAVPIRTGFNY